MTLLGRSHSIVRRLRSLRRSREERDAQRVLVAEGMHLASEALAAGAEIELAVVSPALLASQEGAATLERLRRSGVTIHETADSVLESLQDARSPQPIMLVVRRSEPELSSVLIAENAPVLLVVTYGIQDPGNLGSILRTAAAAGATGLVASGDGADLYHPRTVRATTGSIFRLPAARADATIVLERLRRLGIESVAADARGKVGHLSCDLRSSVALWLGREGSGLPPGILDAVDRTVRIPMTRGVESLAAPAAAAVLLYEALRQRRPGEAR